MLNVIKKQFSFYLWIRKKKANGYAFNRLFSPCDEWLEVLYKIYIVEMKKRQFEFYSFVFNVFLKKRLILHGAIYDTIYEIELHPTKNAVKSFELKTLEDYSYLFNEITIYLESISYS